MAKWIEVESRIVSKSAEPGSAASSAATTGLRQKILMEKKSDFNFSFRFCMLFLENVTSFGSLRCKSKCFYKNGTTQNTETIWVKNKGFEPCT